ncbi:DUF192 domain-containing protein [Sphingomonas sp. VNH70]|uniref:DUF192 domain-containing protein n=1 Tax=Sphingomonas silueang TaxID=3156617 RepID=UPI0032B534BA
MRGLAGLAACALLATLGGCQGSAPGNDSTASGEPARTEVTIATAAGPAHRFNVDVAASEAQQQQGLMYRTAIPADGGMLFAPYPPGGGPPKAASFWMKNTPSPLDILFIRPDGTIATIAENTVPFSETPVASGEPVSAVLELAGGRSAELGIAAGDKVTWK